MSGIISCVAKAHGGLYDIRAIVALSSLLIMFWTPKDWGRTPRTYVFCPANYKHFEN